jgi:hypothetical protein
MIDFFSEQWTLLMAGERQAVFFWISLYCFLILGYSSVRQLRCRRWPSVWGRLEKSGLRKVGGTAWSKSDQEYATDALYHYEVDNEHYEGKRVSPWIVIASHNARFVLEKQMAKIHTRGEDEVRVFYNPRNPRKSFLILPGWFGLAVCLAGALLPGFFWLRANLF